MRTQAGEGLDCRHCLQACDTEWHLYCNRLDEAEQSARRALEMADKERTAHHAAGAQANSAPSPTGGANGTALRGHAEAGEEAVRNAKLAGTIAEFLLWARSRPSRAGDEVGGQRLLRQAVSRAARLQSVRSYSFYNALCAFHRRRGDLSAALAVRDRELATLVGKGQFLDECQARVDRCRLLRQMGRPLADDLAAAREAAKRLRDPAAHLAELDRIEAEGCRAPTCMNRFCVVSGFGVPMLSRPRGYIFASSGWAAKA